jgi:AraC-like DNA-binding protein
MALQLDLVMAGVDHVTPDYWRLDELNPYAKFYLPLEGEGEVGIGHTREKICPGHIYYIPPWVPLELRCERDFKHAWVHFYILEGQGLRGELQDRILQFKPENPSFTEACFLEFGRWTHQGLTSRLETTFMGCLYVIMGDFMGAFPELFVADDNIHPVLADTLAYINEHLKDDLSSDFLARRTLWSRVYFAQLFSQAYGYGPREYIIQKRLMEARRLLCESTRPIREVAEAVGLKDAYYFSRLFKQRHGVSPNQFRKAGRWAKF